MAASWILVPCLVSLRNEFNKLAPDRDHASDGSIGNESHAASSSDHNPDETGNTPYEDADNVNEVHAIDTDSDLKKPGWNMTKCVQIIVTRHREGRDDRLQNVIYNRVIWSRSWGWTAREYTGSSPHTEHAHFSARYTTAQENDTSPWGLLEADDMTKDEFKDWMSEWATSAAGKEALARAVLTFDPGKDTDGNIKPGGVINYGDDKATNPTVQPSFAMARGMLAAIVAYDTRDRVDALTAVMKTAIANEAARDAQEQARDVATKTVLDALFTKAQQPGQVVMSEDQFEKLQQTIAQKVAEAGQDVADATTWKLNQVAELMAQAGETLSTADDVPPQPQQ